MPNPAPDSPTKKKRNTSGRRRSSLSNFLEDTSNSTSTSDFKFNCPGEDLKSVITFSAEDRETRNFKELAGRLSTNDVSLDVGSLTLNHSNHHHHDVSDDELELLKVEKKKTNARPSRRAPIANDGGLASFLSSPKNKMKSSVETEDIKTVVTFSSIDRDRDAFLATSRRLSCEDAVKNSLFDVILNKGEDDSPKTKPRPRPRMKKVVSMSSLGDGKARPRVKKGLSNNNLNSLAENDALEPKPSPRSPRMKKIVSTSRLGGEGKPSPRMMKSSLSNNNLGDGKPRPRMKKALSTNNTSDGKPRPRMQTGLAKKTSAPKPMRECM